MTTQTRFTPGKWQNMEGFPCYVETEAGLPIAVTHPHEIAHREAVDGVDCPDLDECIANGILLAAAPRLYAELDHLVSLLEPLEQSGALNVPGLATLNAARDALKQARGEV